MSTYRREAEKLVREHGTRSEKERLEAGRLPDDDLDRAVSEVIFGPVFELQLPVRRKAKPESVREYAKSLGQAHDDDEVYFEVIENDTKLHEAEWEALKAIKTMLPEARVEPYALLVKCGRYSRRSYAAKIEVLVGDRVRRLDLMLTPERRERAEERHARKAPEVSYKRPK